MTWVRLVPRCEYIFHDCMGCCRHALRELLSIVIAKHGSHIASHAGAVAASRNAEVADALSSPFRNAWQDVERSASVVARHPRLFFGALAAVTAVGVSYLWRCASFSLLQALLGSHDA